LGPITRSLLVRDAKSREELAQALLKGQNERLDISVMDAKERSNADVTGLLQAWRGGDLEARDRLATVVYQELRRRAGAYLRRERIGHTLQPTALVHEVFLLRRRQRIVTGVC
jgi:ECF sigma factor